MEICFFLLFLSLRPPRPPRFEEEEANRTAEDAEGWGQAFLVLQCISYVLRGSQRGVFYAPPPWRATKPWVFRPVADGVPAFWAR